MTDEIILEEAVTEKPQRVHILDGIRGFAIFMMILHHFIFNMSYPLYDGSDFAKFCVSIYSSELVEVYLQPLFQCTFIFISGISCRYSRSNLKRGVITLLFGMGLEIVTCYILPVIDPVLFAGCEIRCGILTLLGSCMVIWGVFGKWLDKIMFSEKTGMVFPLLMLVLWFIFYQFSESWFDFEGFEWFGFPSRTFATADYFPLFPWLFMFLLGARTGKYIRENKFPAFFYRIRIPFFDFIGRYTVWIYLLHQPVIFGISYLLFG